MRAISTLMVALVVAVAAVAVGLVSGFPTGGADCNEPGHGVAGMGESTDHLIEFDEAIYTPGGAAFNITIRSVAMADFRGFLLWAEDAWGTRVGSFNLPSTAGGNARLIQVTCDTTTGAATATHGQRINDNSVTVSWSAPAAFRGTLTFKGVVVIVEDTWFTLPETTLTTPYVPSTDASLGALDLALLATPNLMPAFQPNVTAYSATARSVEAEVRVEAVANSSQASLTFNGAASNVVPLDVGLNEIVVEVTAEDLVSTQEYTLNVTRAAAGADSDSSLASLSLTPGALVPAFDTAVLAYTASVAAGADTIAVAATPTNALGAGVIINGADGVTSFDLVAGTNRLEVVVTAENGINATTYVIVVVRAGVSIDLSAISLAATTVAPAFDVLTLAYTATQANTEVFAEVTVTLVDAGASVTIGGVSGTAVDVPLRVVGETAIEIVVSNPGGDTRTTVLTVTREGVESMDPRDFPSQARLAVDFPYFLYWEVLPNGFMVGQVEANVAGWVGLGISPTGQMDGDGTVGSDIMVFWVGAGCENGCIFDYSTTVKSLPVKDASQDVFVLGGDEIDGTTRVRWIRALDTGDTDADYVFDTGIGVATTFILAAHETLDPNADGSVFFKHNLGQATATVALTTSNDDPASAGNTTWCEDSGANLFCLSWVIQGESIVFTIVAKTTGWVGFGLTSNPGRMFPADVALAWVDENGGHLVDAASSQYNLPRPDMENDLTLVSATSEDGELTVSFQRLLTPLDPADAVIEDRTMDVIWALRDGDFTQFSSLAQHSNKGAGSINFFTGVSEVVSSGSSIAKLRAAHGILMFLAWGVCLAIGTFFARYMKNMGHRWFVIHVSLQALGVVLFVVGFALAMAMTFSAGATHFSGVHQIFGLVVTLGGLFQPLSGYLADKFFTMDRSNVPVWPDKFHWYVGRTVQVLSIPTVYLGLSAYDARLWVWLVVTVVFFFILCLYLWKQFTQGQVTHDANTPIHDKVVVEKKNGSEEMAVSGDKATSSTKAASSAKASSGGSSSGSSDSSGTSS